MYNKVNISYKGELVMNVITELGNFLVAYGTYIETALILAAAVAAVIVVVMLVKGSKKKTRILTDINENVDKINSAVNQINDKTKNGAEDGIKDVIYIDNRAPEEKRETVSQEEQGIKSDIEKRKDRVETPDGERRSDIEVAKESEKEKKAEIKTMDRSETAEANELVTGDRPEGRETPEINSISDTKQRNTAEVKKTEAPKRFMTRDCAVSKQGREYTLEELIEQIKN